MVNIQDYEDVARALSANVDPQQDIFFAQGPMDVLDHSCSKLAFGGKMCIDATRKLEEESRFSLEKVDDGTLRIGIISGSKEEVKQWGDSLKQLISISYPEIVDLNTTWVELGISVVFISVKKNRRNHIRELNDKLFLTTTLNQSIATAPPLYN